jgi:hypothetical protein
MTVLTVGLQVTGAHFFKYILSENLSALIKFKLHLLSDLSIPACNTYLIET